MQLASCVVDRELPVDRGALLVTGGLPGGDLGDQGVAVADAAAQALAGQHRELQLTEPKMIHVLSLVLQHVTIPERVTVACSMSLPPDAGVRLRMVSCGQRLVASSSRSRSIAASMSRRAPAERLPRP